MKVVSIYGSPKTEGTSSNIGRLVTDKFRKKCNIKEYSLNSLSYRGCQGCLKCKTGFDRCVIKDDLTDILDSIEEADTLIISSGIYFGDVTSQTKTFIDRLYSFYVPGFLDDPSIVPLSRLKKGKSLIMVLTQGHPDESFFNDIFPRYNYLISRHGFVNNRLLRFTGISPKSGKLNSGILKKIESFSINY